MSKYKVIVNEYNEWIILWDLSSWIQSHNWIQLKAACSDKPFSFNYGNECNALQTKSNIMGSKHVRMNNWNDSMIVDLLVMWLFSNYVINKPDFNDSNGICEQYLTRNLKELHKWNHNLSFIISGIISGE